MKIQVIQTLPNGQVTQQVLSKEGSEVLKIQAQPGAKISFNVEGAKPAEAMNAKAKTSNIKKSGNNLVLESEGEQLVEVTDFYSTAGASVGSVGWNYAATDATVMSATPEAQAFSSDAAVSESGALFPAIAPGWLIAGGAATVAAVASGGSSSVASGGITSSVISGVITAGPVVAANGLTVAFFKKDGTALGTAMVDGTGHFTKTLTGVGAGEVVIAKVVNDADINADYIDETTHQGVDLTAQLLGVGVVGAGSTLTLNINPLTTVAARKAGLLADGSGVVADATTANNANAAVAAAFGVTDPTTTTPTTTVDSTGASATVDISTAAGKLGALLAAISGMDSTSTAQASIDALVSGVTTTGATATMNAAAQTALMTGAVKADAGATLNLQQTISNLLATNTQPASLKIDAIATDNIVIASETTGLVISGTVTSGTAPFTLSLNGSAAAGSVTVTGGTWTYALVAGDITALGTDGVKTISATAAGVTSSRLINLDVTAPTATLANSTAGVVVNLVEATAAAGVDTITVEANSSWVATLTKGSNVVTKTGIGTGATQAITLTAADIAILGDGAITVSVTATDGASNTTTVAAGGNFTLDTLVAPLSMVNTAAGAVVNLTEATAVAGVTSVTSETGAAWDITFTGIAGVVHKTGTGTGSAQAVVLAAGDIITLGQGAVAVSVTATDAALNPATVSTGGNFTLDTEAPTIAAGSLSINAPENGTVVNLGAALATNDTGATFNTTLGGPDAALFSITTGGVLTLLAAKNFEVDALTTHSYSILVTVLDANGNSQAQTVTVNLTNLNEAPTAVGTIGAKTAVVNQLFSLATAAYFADVDAGGLNSGVYSATGLGNGLSINASTGVISGTALANAANAPVVVTFTDAGGLAVSQAAFNLQAVSAPVVQGFTAFDATGVTTKGMGGESVTFAVTFSEAITVTGTLTAVFSVNGQAVTATYTGAGGASTLNFTGGTVPSTGDGTVISLTSLTGTTLGNVSGQPMVAPTAAALTTSVYTVDNTAPTVTAAYASNENAGTDTTPHTITLVGTDTNGPVTFSGLTGADAAKFSLNSTTGVLSFVGQTNFEAADDVGANHVYDLSVIATDAVGKITTQAVTVTLQDVNETPTLVGTIATQHAISGTAFSLSTAANFADVDTGANGTLTYSATGLASGLIINATTGVISGTHSGAVASAAVSVTATDGGGLHTAQTFNMDVVVAPALALTQALDGTTNLSVQSALEISFDQSVTLASGHIHIYDDMGTAGWAHSNAATAETKIDVSKNDIDITLVNGVATAVTIGGVDYTSRFDLAHSVMVGDATHTAASGLASSGTNLLIDLKPAIASAAGTGVFSTAFDWDFGSNYHVNFDAGIVTNSAGVANAALNDGSATATGALQNTALNFTTVTPVNTVAAAITSVLMDATGATTATTSSFKWVNANQGINDGTAPLTFDLAANSIALVQDSNGGTTKSGSLGQNITVANFGFENGVFTKDDIIYMDNHGLMSLATTDGLASTSSTWQNGITRLMSGASTGTNGLAGTPYLTFDLTNSPAALLSSMGTQDTQFEGSTKMGYNAVIFG